MSGHRYIGWLSLALGIVAITLSLLAGTEVFSFLLGMLSLVVGLVTRFAAKDNFGVAGIALGLIAALNSLGVY